MKENTKDNMFAAITGGTGTFGKAFINATMSTFNEIRIFSRDEKKQEDMRIKYKNDKIKFYIGDVQRFESIIPAMQGVDLVFHAAALKQVPSCEFFPMEAIRTNAIGAQNVMQAAVQCKVKKMVVLSTDKAVYPINAMGISKAMMEKLMIAMARTHGESGPLFCGTRYGNVMGSRGSVIPLFINQIKSGQPMTITDPNMTRFMMPIEGAIDLVLYAFDHAKPGDIFVQKAPAATIAVLAEALQQVFKAKNEIKYIGTRHGEKLYETLLTREEMARAEDMGDYYRIPADTRDLNYNLYFVEGKQEVEKELDYNSHNTKRLNVDEMAEMLLKLEFVQEELREWKP